MKTIMKRIAVFALIAAMTVAAFCGCSKKTGTSSADSMFGVMEESLNLDKWEGTVTLTMDTAQMNVSADLTAVCDGNATSFSAKISAGGFSFEIKNFVVATKDAMYFNIGAIYDSMGSYLAATGLSLEDMGLEKDWIVYTAEDAFKKDTDFSSSVLDAMDEAYKDLIVEEDGEYKLAFSDKEGAQKFLDATVALLEKNKDKWSEDLADAMSKVDYSSIKNDIIDANEKAGNVLDEDTIDEMFSVDEDTVKVPSKEDCAELFDKAIESLKEGDLEDFEGNVALTASAKGKEYKYKAEMAYEDESISLEAVINKTADVKVEVPSEDEAVSYADFLIKYYSYIENSYGYDDYDDYDDDDDFYYNDDYKYDEEEYYDDEDVFSDIFGEDAELFN